LALRLARRERADVEHLLHELAELALVMAARLRDERASLRNDVPRRATGDDPDVRRRLLVHAAEPQVRDRLRRGLDRRPSLLRRHARMRRPAEKRDLEPLRKRGAEDDLADRPLLVVDETELRPQPRRVERRRPVQADLLLPREDELDPCVRDVLDEDAPRPLEHLDDRRLVVAPEDRPAHVPDHAVLDHRPQLAGRRHRVEMGAEEERRPLRRRLEPRVDVAEVVLARAQAEPAEITDDDVRHRLLLTRRRRDGRELEKELYDVAHAATRSPVRERARSSAAPTKPRKSGAARVGLDLNSGWNWLATNHGWPGSSTISTSRPSWNVPLTTRPASTSRSRYALFTSQRCRWRSWIVASPYNSRVRVPSATSTACAPSRIVPPRSSIPFCSGSRSMTGNGVSGSISVEFAPSRPTTCRANSDTATCMPRQMPRYGICRSRATWQARIFPSQPRDPKPPGTSTPSTVSSSSAVSSYDMSSASTHCTWTAQPCASPPCFSASWTERYAS